MAPCVVIFRLNNLLYAADWIVQLLGFSPLTRLLLNAGEERLAIPAFIAVFVAAILGVLRATFHLSVESWAVQEAA